MDRDFSGADAHCAPFVRETLTTKSLHFSFSATQSEMQTLNPDRLHLVYTRLMMGFLLFKPAPEAVAMIGLGGGSMAKFIHRQLPETQLKVVEINPFVIELRERFGVPPDDERFRVRCDDGAAFVRAPPRLYDALLVDGFDVHGQPPALASQAFYDDCARSLTPDGVLVVNLHSRDEGFDAQVDRLHRAFDTLPLLVPVGDQCNTIAFVSREPLAPRVDPSPVLRLHRHSRDAWHNVLPAMTKVAKRAARMAPAA